MKFVDQFGISWFSEDAYKRLENNLDKAYKIIELASNADKITLAKTIDELNTELEAFKTALKSDAITWHCKQCRGDRKVYIWGIRYECPSCAIFYKQ